jgi:predicted MFS family arabinose efflux permease
VIPETESIMSASPNSPAHGLTPLLILLLAMSAGLSVASLYYSQPMLGVLGADIGAASRSIGLVPTLTQLGYALGILLLAPLGDRYDRRRIILVKSGVLLLALLAAGLAPSIHWLLLASLVIGLAATLAQDIVPAAATLASAEQRGRVVGTVMTGLLLGILLSRVVSGVVAELFGWRSMFVIAALSILAVAYTAWRHMQAARPATNLSYVALLASLLDLWRAHPTLRRAALAQGLLALSFSAFWSTLAVMLHGEPFHLGSAAAGAFGLAGAAGALVAPLAGHLADRRGPGLVTRLGAALTTLAFAGLTAAWLWAPSGAQLALLAIGTLLFDLGVQATLIAHQTQVYQIDPGARSRLNAVLFVGMFSGMASGAVLGSLLLASWGWAAVMGMATLSAAGALGVRLRAA